MEPAILRNGKIFHRRVQADWHRTAKGGRITAEHSISLLPVTASASRPRRGRIDIFVDELGDFVSVVEIKATDWDRVQPRNRRKLLASHQRQVLRYIERFLDGDNIDVCPGIIYPSAPRTPGLREEIETYLNEHGFQIVWYDD